MLCHLQHAAGTMSGSEQWIDTGLMFKCLNTEPTDAGIGMLLGTTEACVFLAVDSF
eukprot:m.292983 g.292983  ORF g.292983 m.292983 type:complete len:56 (+) comp20013_c0_seq1:1740-1907(+)